MTIVKRKDFLLILILFLFFSPICVQAAANVDNDCLDDGSCILVCNYNNKYTGTYHQREVEYTRNISIYYYLDDQQWALYWERATRDTYIFKKGPNSLSYIFSNKGSNVYSQNIPSVENFTCPSHGYLDFSNLNGNNEICFDDDGSTCRDDYSNIGTAFKKNSYVSDEKDYDYNDDLNHYFSNWSYGDITCDQIISREVNAEDISNKIINDVKTNYLHGHNVPSFIANSSAFKNVSNTAISSLKSKKQECIQEINAKQENGEITVEEANEQLNIINGIDEDEALDNIQSAITELITNNSTDQYWNKEITCKDIFDFDTEGSVGWILQTILNYIKVLGPIAVVLLSALDFINAILSSDEKAMKEAQSKLIIRLIAAVALFLIPTLVELLMNLINTASCSIS